MTTIANNSTFTPLSAAELEDLKARLMKGRKDRVVTLRQVYNGPFTRACPAPIARRAMKDMVARGMAKPVATDTWAISA